MAGLVYPMGTWSGSRSLIGGPPRAGGSSIAPPVRGLSHTASEGEGRHASRGDEGKGHDDHGLQR